MECRVCCSSSRTAHHFADSSGVSGCNSGTFATRISSYQLWFMLVWQSDSLADSDTIPRASGINTIASPQTTPCLWLVV